MSTISLITYLVLSLSGPTYTEVVYDNNNIFFYRQKNNLYSITNLSTDQKFIGINTRLGKFSLRLSNIDTEDLKMAISGLEEVKKQAAKNRFDPENYSYYEKILDSSRYSDQLAYTFLCWRTAYQAYNHGVSNYSYIPNGFYNKKKKKVINKLRNAPDRIRSSQQIAYLENLSDIVPGGLMGNSVLDDMAFLYNDPDMDN